MVLSPNSCFLSESLLGIKETITPIKFIIKKWVEDTEF